MRPWKFCVRIIILSACDMHNYLCKSLCLTCKTNLCLLLLYAIVILTQSYFDEIAEFMAYATRLWHDGTSFAAAGVRSGIIIFYWSAESNRKWNTYLLSRCPLGRGRQVNSYRKLCKRIMLTTRLLPVSIVTHSHLFMYFGRTNLNKINFPLPPQTTAAFQTLISSRANCFRLQTRRRTWIKIIIRCRWSRVVFGIVSWSSSSSSSSTVVYFVAGTFNSIKTNETLCQSWIFICLTSRHRVQEEHDVHCCCLQTLVSHHKHSFEGLGGI